MLKKVTYIIILLALFVMAGCEEPTQPTIINVDPLFREFYDLLGGQDILGPTISTMYEDRGRKLQFTTSVLMMYDPQAPESSRFQLVSLGNTLKVADPPLTATSPDGHEIYPGFLPLFRQLGGTRNTGKPITSVKADPEHNRIVQYFENVGFYQLESDPPDMAHLLDYGIWKCAQACGYSSPRESIVIPPATPGYGIEGAIDRLDPSLTGFPLTEIYTAEDGREEQIFEYVVICTDPDSPGGIALRPLPQLMGIYPEPSAPAGTEVGKFIAVDGNNGYNVPYQFDEYIQRNNGYAFIGKPINFYSQINDTLYRQCFENLCLDYHPNEIEGLQIRPMSLGRRYRQQVSNESNIESANSYEAVTLTVWERYPVINSVESQQIQTLVLENGNPLKNIDLILTVDMPDGQRQTFNFPPTGRDGQAQVEIGPIDAPNGTLVAYQVCIANISDATDCISDDFLIWLNP